METFRQKANAGYTELLKWVMTEPENPGEPEELIAKRKSVRRERGDRRKSKVEIGKERERRKIKAEDDWDEEQMSLKTRSNFGDTDDDGKNVIEVDSEEDIFSEFNSERGSHKKKKDRQADEPDKPKVVSTSSELFKWIDELHMNKCFRHVSESYQ